MRNLEEQVKMKDRINEELRRSLIIKDEENRLLREELAKTKTQAFLGHKYMTAETELERASILQVSLEELRV